MKNSVFALLVWFFTSMLVSCGGSGGGSVSAEGDNSSADIIDEIYTTDLEAPILGDIKVEVDSNPDNVIEWEYPTIVVPINPAPPLDGVLIIDLDPPLVGGGGVEISPNPGPPQDGGLTVHIITDPVTPMDGSAETSPNPDMEYRSTIISAPVDRSAYDSGTSVAFSGSGSDVTGEAIESDLLIWTSSLDGPIGTGESFTTCSLSPGLHLITLSVQGEMSSNDQIRIAVGTAQQYHDTIVKTLSVGNSPHSIVVSPDGSHVYVTQYSDKSVSVIRTSDHTVIDSIPVGNHPTGLAAMPDGSGIFVINSSDGTISMIETSTNTVVATLTLPSTPKDLGVSPDGEFLYVATNDSPDLLIYQICDLSRVNSITMTAAPSFIRVHPNENLIYMANFWDHTVKIADPSNNSSDDVVSFPDAYPTDMVLTAAGDLYVATDDYSISVIQTPGDILQDTIHLPFCPARIKSPNSSYIYLLPENDNAMSVLQTTSKVVIDAIPVGDDPIDMAISPDGEHVYVVNSDGTVSVIGKTEW